VPTRGKSPAHAPMEGKCAEERPVLIHQPVYVVAIRGQRALPVVRRVEDSVEMAAAKLFLEDQ